MYSSIFILTFAAVMARVYMSATCRNIWYGHGYDFFNPISYNLAIYLLTGLIGSFAIVIAPEGQSINEVIDSFATPELRVLGFLIMLYGAIVFVFTARYFRKIFKYEETANYQSSRTIGVAACNFLTLTFLGALTYYTASRLGPLIAVLRGNLDGWGVMAMRAELAEMEKEGFFIRRVFVEGWCWIFVLYLSTIKRYRWQFYILAFAMSLFFLASLAKIKVVIFLISIYMARAWGRSIGVGTVLKVAAVVFLALLVIWGILVRNLNPEYLFSFYSEGLVGRIFISEISALYPHLSIFGHSENHIGIASLSNSISSILDIAASPRSGRIVLEVASPSWAESGIGGVFNTVFFGEAYANFSYPGLLLSPVWIALFYGILVWASQALSPRLRVAFLIHAALNTSVMAGFNDYLWDPFLIFLYVSLLAVSKWTAMWSTTRIRLA